MPIKLTIALRLVAQCVPPVSSQIQVCVNESLTIWLANTGESSVSLSAGELFGFNLGTYENKPLGTYDKRNKAIRKMIFGFHI